MAGWSTVERRVFRRENDRIMQSPPVAHLATLSAEYGRFRATLVISVRLTHQAFVDIGTDLIHAVLKIEAQPRWKDSSEPENLEIRCEPFTLTRLKEALTLINRI